MTKLICKPNWKKIKIIPHLLATSKIALPQIVILVYYQMDKIMIEYFTHDSAIIAFYDQSDKIVKIPVTAITAVSAVNQEVLIYLLVMIKIN